VLPFIYYSFTPWHFGEAFQNKRSNNPISTTWCEHVGGNSSGLAPVDLGLADTPLAMRDHAPDTEGERRWLNRLMHRPSGEKGCWSLSSSLSSSLPIATERCFSVDFHRLALELPKHAVRGNALSLDIAMRTKILVATNRRYLINTARL